MVIGIDLGGTNIHAGVVDNEGNILDYIARPYSKGECDEVMGAIVETVLGLKEKYPEVKRAGLVSAGQVDRKRGLLLYPVNIKGLTEVPVVEILQEKTGLVLFCENDAVGAALAEGWVGMAASSSTFITVTLGTGVGTGAVLHNKVLHGGLNLGCEWGHIAMGLESVYKCGCGNSGCIETFCSATALAQIAVSDGLDIKSAKDVCMLASSGDALALKIMEKYSSYLGIALYNYTIILNPEVIIIAGGLSRSSGLFLSRAIEKLREMLSTRPYMFPPKGVVCSTFPDYAGVLGAAYLCMEKGRIVL
jgi:glucokinase